jgi:myo-inositol-1(or 4)-monophosphatase
MNYQEVLDQVIELAKQVGTFQKNNMFKADLSIDTKSTETDLVTEIDKKSDEMILNHIRTHFPRHSVLTEESGESDLHSDYRWVIDPLDGTTNFAQGLPIFTVSIALQHKGQTVLGVVYNPVVGDLFTAIQGNGAYRNGQRITVSKKTSLKSSVLATGFPYDIAQNPVNNLAYFNHLSIKARAVRRFGSAAYDLALVADGRFDGYWEMALNPWDVAAGLLLVEEAGGKIVHFRHDRKISLIAGNETLCGLILRELEGIGS